MRRFIAGTLIAVAASGCGPALATHVQSDRLGLGRVVVYRNGVAYYERHARVRGGALTVNVPRDRVDDFLKSLTVVDAATHQPLPVAFARQQAADSAVIAMTLQVPTRAADADVKLTYVTEAPAWKPSYRLAMADDGSMMLEGWAIVDNVSGEDWNRVEVGVGSSAAMSFRYDLWGVRTVDRAELAPAEQFAVAPPTAVSPYGGTSAPQATVIDLAAGELREVENGARDGELTKHIPAGRTFGAVLGAAAGTQADVTGAAVAGSTSLESSYATGGSLTSSVSGAVVGRVLDKATKEPVIGATIVATGPALAGQLAEITDESGAYRLGNLPPGNYQITVYYNDSQFSRPNVHVAIGKQTTVSIPIATDSHTAETIELEARAPIIDQSSYSTGVTIDRDYVRNIPVPARSSGGSRSTYRPPPPPDPAVLARAAIAAGDQKLAAAVPGLIAQKAFVVVEGYAAPGEADGDQRALARAHLVRNQLIDAGVAPARVRAVSKGVVAGRGAGVQLVTTGAPGDSAHATGAHAALDPGAPPVGESHFMSAGVVTVGRGTSAMVSVLRRPTDGQLVYLYDPSSQRGNQRFAFRAVRMINPTDATLEPGPITVYGAGRYVGEGLTEPILPSAAAVIPFALDRQVVVERDHGSRDRLERLASIQRGVLTADVQHVRTTALTLTSRLPGPTTVYVRHPATAGWTLVDPPGPVERIGDAYLIAVELAGGATRTVELAEETPTVQVLDLGADPTLAMLAVFVASERPSPALKARLTELLAHHRALVDGAARIDLLRQRIDEYRVRARELEGQLLGLRKLKGAADLQRSLAGKLDDTATRGQQATLDLVTAQEELMLTRVRFQDALADLPTADALASAR